MRETHVGQSKNNGKTTNEEEEAKTKEEAALEHDLFIFSNENVSPLNTYATRSRQTRGRPIPEEDDYRTAFARDRDRIIYSEAFFRLAGKTQVFLSPQDPLISTRMTHVIHVSQIARSIARAIGANEDLTEAIALGHDLGHPPFGHNGEKVLEKKTRDHGIAPFRHNLHSLRVVDTIEKKGNGLNLTWEVREGIVKHNGEKHETEIFPSKFEGKAPYDVYEINSVPDTPCTLEGCIMRICDRIAYAGKDFEDAIRAGLIKRSDIPRIVENVLGNKNSRIIDVLVKDIVSNFRNDLRSFYKTHRRMPEPYEISIRMSREVANAAFHLIEEFNYPKIYFSRENQRYQKQTQFIVEHLFDSFFDELQSAATGRGETTLDDFVTNAEWKKDPPLDEWGMWLRELYRMPLSVLDVPCLYRGKNIQIKEVEEGKKIIKDLREAGVLSPEQVEIFTGEEHIEPGVPFLSQCMSIVAAVRNTRLRIIRRFAKFRNTPTSIFYFLSEMSDKYILNSRNAEIVCDYIASLTDDAAITVFKRLTIPQSIV